jgi:hypothetical protein
VSSRASPRTNCPTATPPLGGLYQPIWKYDVKTLASDLGGHLIYGATTGTVFWLVTKLG